MIRLGPAKKKQTKHLVPISLSNSIPVPPPLSAAITPSLGICNIPSPHNKHNSICIQYLWYSIFNIYYLWNPTFNIWIFPRPTISLTTCHQYLIYPIYYILYVYAYIIYHLSVGYAIFPHHTISITIRLQYQYRNWKGNVGNNSAKVETSWSNTHKQILLKDCIWIYTYCKNKH